MKSMTLRVISLFVAVAFTMTTLTGSPSQAFASSGIINPIGGVGAQTALRKDLYAMPAELGSLVSLWEAPAGSASKNFVIQIQDAHANPEGQQNVAGILKYFETKSHGLVVGLEGAIGELHPEYLNFFKEYPDANRAVIEDLKQKGELNGAEIFLLQKSQKRLATSDQRPETKDVEASAPVSSLQSSVFGVEDATLYRDNLKTFRDLLSHRDEIEVLLNPVRVQLEKESSQKLNGELRDFLKERSRRKDGDFGAQTTSQGNADLQAYVRYLEEQVSKVLAIDLKDPIEQLRFPSLLRVVKIEEAQKGFDSAKAGEQWKKAVEGVKSAAKNSSEKEFAEAFAAFGREKGFIPAANGKSIAYSMDRSLYPRKLLEGLFRFGQKHKLSFAGQEAFWQSWKLVVFQAEINVTELLQEISALEDGLIQKLARTEEEKALVRKLGDFDLLEKMLRLELSRDEYNKTVSNQDGLESFTGNSKPLRAFLEKAYHFYDISLQRDEALVENLLTSVERKGDSENLNAKRYPLAVLYSGGFHTSGVEEILRQKGIGYAVFTP
ncbi:MAG: hypothetical protein PHV97_00285, partial [Candidatus Omnitrophica bacterium]|nr:hypothetical protein [Candidatus Omnitrophota bacterium]